MKSANSRLFGFMFLVTIVCVISTTFVVKEFSALFESSFQEKQTDIYLDKLLIDKDVEQFNEKLLAFKNHLEEKEKNDPFILREDNYLVLKNKVVFIETRVKELEESVGAERDTLDFELKVAGISKIAAQSYNTAEYPIYIFGMYHYSAITLLIAIIAMMISLMSMTAILIVVYKSIESVLFD